MHQSKLPLTTRFWAAHVMATHSNGMSARQLENQLGVTYKTAWLLAQKLRRSMVDSDRDLLEGVVEVDQTRGPETYRDIVNRGANSPSGGSKTVCPCAEAAAPQAAHRRATWRPGLREG